MAFSRGGYDYDVWRYDLKGGEPPRKFIASTAWDSSGEYSPDGRRIAFESNRSGSREIWVCDAEGANPVQITHFGGPVSGTTRWSPDGRQIAFDARPDGNSEIFVVNSEGGGLRRLTQTRVESARPDWSPDGKFIYFSSNRGGSSQLWRIPAAGGDAVQITKQGGFALRASPDGGWLYYSPKETTASVWKVHPDGSGEGEAFPVRMFGLEMAVTPGALYGWTVTGPPNSYSVQSLRFSDGKISQIFPLDFNPGLGLSLTPDERYLLLTKPDQKGTDLMLVEGFH